MTKYKTLSVLALSLAILALSQTGLVAQSMGGGVLYSSYLPFTSLYNSLETENSATKIKSTRDDLTINNSNILHYAPGGGITTAYAISGTLTTVDFGIMGGSGKDNIIPDFPVRPFISVNFAGKFVNTQVLSLYGMAGIYIDIAVGKSNNDYDFGHLLLFFRLGSGVSFKLAPKIELFTQVQFGIGFQVENISLSSKAGNKLYEAKYFMVPIALFPELGIRFWF